MTAALYLARFLRSVVVYDAGNGRAAMIPRTYNLAPFPEGISGTAVLERMRHHAELYGATLKSGTVTAIERQGDIFRITTDQGVDVARSVMFATGVINLRPPLSEKEHDLGLSRGLIRYCPVCDGYEVRGKRVAVLGGGRHDADEARFIQHYSADVTLIQSDRKPVAPIEGIRVFPSAMKSLALSESEIIVTLENAEQHRFDTLYVAMGTTARTSLVAALGVRLSEKGCVVVNAKQRTNIDRVYAIGDVTEGLDQIAIAMGHGVTAATDIHNDLRIDAGIQPSRDRSSETSKELHAMLRHPAK